MDCNVIKDLIPLYIDDCCSEESMRIVKEHIDSCSACKALYEDMNTPCEMNEEISAPISLNRINDWKASILQSVLLFISFAVIILGVSLEASTPVGLGNGTWAFFLVVPATGFMLSLVNWYFVRFYKNRKSFANGSLLATIVFTVCAYVWTGFHYEITVFDLIELFKEAEFINFRDFLETCFGTGVVLMVLYGNGILLSVFFCGLSKAFANEYAKMLGKE